MIYVPDKFKTKHPFPYPADNHYEFERWYHDEHLLTGIPVEEREYLPVFWTAYYCKHSFCQDAGAMEGLQKFLNGLDRSKKYYTIVQYDNGIQNDISHLDIIIFSMSGGRTDYPLPLISCEHDRGLPFERNLLLSFAGQITHSIRQVIIDTLRIKKDCYITTKKLTIPAFCMTLKSSIFTLCPRGFGPTSFRIQEALQHGSIPVYISDEFIIPHNLPFDEYGVLIDAKDAARVHEILSSISPEEIRRRQAAIPDVYKQYFTYEGNKEAIKKAVAECSYTAGSISI